MKKRTALMAPVAMAILVGVTAACGGGGTSQPAATQAPAAATQAPASTTGGTPAGQAVFQQNCNSCHPGGNQGTGPAIKGRPVDRVKNQVRKGGDGMPAFSASQISDQELNDLAAYVASLK